jgi:catechol 2,3-dioxygenase-like lactoylglutathione lyase family enzyme
LSRNPFSHIDLRVWSFPESVEFYRAFLPLLGFTKFHDYEGWKGWSMPAISYPERPFFGCKLDPNHRPNATRIAFWAESREKVDEIARALAAVGARNVEGPIACAEYSEDYYAIFFEDPSGNLLEVVHRTR